MLYYTTVISESRNHVKILVGRDCITNTDLTQKLSTAVSEISLFFVALTTATILHAVQSPQTFYDSCLSTGQMQRSIWGTTRDHYQLWNVVNRLKQETALVALFYTTPLPDISVPLPWLYLIFWPMPNSVTFSCFPIPSKTQLR